MSDKQTATELTDLEKAAFMSGENIWQSRAFPHAGIRSLFFADGPHGVRKQTGSGDHLGIAASEPATCFPTSATIANSWDPTLAQDVGEALGAEAASQDVDVLLGPGLNIKRSPLCGRNFEYFSEDPYLAGHLAAGYVRGIQSQGTASSPKHFAVNSQELRRMASDSVVDERTLREIYLTAFEIVVREASPRVVMSAYNKVNGEYAHENAHLLTEILRDEWGFDGAVITDWGGSNSAPAAIAAGGGLEMPSPGLASVPGILAALEDGSLSREDLDARVAELRALVRWADGGQARPVDNDAHHELARRAARESAVLLRNEGDILPLAPATRVAVIGDFADTPRYQGAGSSVVNTTRLSTPLDALRSSALEVVAYAQGFERDGTPNEELATQATDAAMGADVVLLYLGLDEVAESEGKDREHLRLHQAQVDLLARLRDVNANIVVILSAGSVIEMPWIGDTAAVLHGYLGGQAGAEGLVDLLTGAASPAGRLAETYPLTLEDTPTAAYYPATGPSSEYREGPYVGYRYYATVGKDVRFPFGHGLSYTTFAYADLTVTDAGASFTITNTGEREGAEVAQMYVSRTSAGVYRPAIELKGFCKVRLAPGETARVTIPFDQYTFRHFDVDAKAWAVEEGDYDIVIGASSADPRLTGAHHVTGRAASAADTTPAPYATGAIAHVSDADFAQLLGRPLTPTATGLLGVNDPLRGMHQAKNPLARLVARILRSLIDRSERKGKPDLNLYFLYNMPFRATAKMTNGMVSPAMVDQIVRIVNGHFFRGAGALIGAFFRNQSTSRALKRELESVAAAAAAK
ncbi:glycoside hydrolase family 3 C-terminal domain-containing protein [Demequina sp. NBRC 110055]|uniref:glycoside hydrolase family 3 C-terminal domain-containing protein n=1 Tax=Demequina sp. NBRC 110055 TaxID=1570344 RepID=UPI000A05D476|nr:glycoside hydrolase family 3 C-terminal domain-containing protein [Demequina sp. NBRC 110055]